MSFSWTQAGGQAVTLTNGDTARPSFTAPDNGAFTFKLEVNDGKVKSTPATVEITATNVDPTITTVTAEPNRLPPEGGTSTITVTATDPAMANDPLRYYFDCDGNRAFEVGPQTANSTACAFNEKASFNTVTVKVDDLDGGIVEGCTTAVVDPVQPDWTLELEITSAPQGMSGPGNLFLGVKGGCSSRIGLRGPAAPALPANINSFETYFLCQPDEDVFCSRHPQLATTWLPPADVRSWVLEVAHPGQLEAISLNWDTSFLPDDFNLWIVDSEGRIDMKNPPSAPHTPRLYTLPLSPADPTKSILLCSQVISRPGVPIGNPCPQQFPAVVDAP